MVGRALENMEAFVCRESERKWLGMCKNRSLFLSLKLWEFLSLGYCSWGVQLSKKLMFVSDWFNRKAGNITTSFWSGIFPAVMSRGQSRVANWCDGAVW